MLLRSIVILMFVAALSGNAQELAFEVASVKPARPPDAGRLVSRQFMVQTGALAGPMADRVLSGGRAGSPGRIDYSAVDLKTLLMRAYGLTAYEISGPAWLDSEF